MFMKQPHRLLLSFILLHLSNSSVSTSLVGHVLYSADLMSATCTPHSYLIVHRYIYSRYSSIFLTLYQLYLFFSFLTLISFSRLYLSIATWVTSQGHNSFCFLIFGVIYLKFFFHIFSASYHMSLHLLSLDPVSM